MVLTRHCVQLYGQWVSGVQVTSNFSIPFTSTNGTNLCRMGELISRYLLSYCLSTWLVTLHFCNHIKVRRGHGICFALFVSWYLKIAFLYTAYSWILIFIQSSNFCLLFEDLLCLHCYNYQNYYIRSIMLLFVPAIVLFLGSTFFALL